MSDALSIKYDLAIMALGILSTGFLGILVFVAVSTLKRIDKMQEMQNTILISIAAIQEQVKTLFSRSEDHAGDIDKIGDLITEQENQIRKLHNRRS